MHAHRVLAVVGALAIGVAVAPLAGTAAVATPPGSAVPAANPGGPAAVPNPANLTWTTCPPSEYTFPRDPRLTCATLAVPLDYRDPHGRTITIAVSRITTSTPGAHRGILLSNPGGPGGPGLDLPSALTTLLPAQVLDEYDLIGFDPRGIGYSTPVTCGLTAVDPTLHVPYPAPDGSIERNVAFARSTAASCAANSGGVMPFMTTANTARDMDAIRAALGEPKLSYYGVSYGTYLGGVYTSLFPGHSDRIVLDSSVGPQLVWYNLFRTWSIGVAQRLPDFTAWAAARDDVYHLGATSEAVRRLYDTSTAALDRHPITLPDGTVLDGNLVRELTRSLLYADASFPTLAADWQRIASLITGGASADPEALGKALNSAIAGPASPAAAAGAIPVDNGIASQLAVLCDDAAWPRDVAGYARNVAIDRRVFPATAGMPANMWACGAWPNAPVQPPVTVTDRGPRDVLMLQNARDPATPLVSALGMRAALGRRATMITVDEGGHGVFGLGSCADAATITFLATGELPAGDQFCPAPTGSASAGTSGTTPASPNTTAGPNGTAGPGRTPAVPLTELITPRILGAW